MHSGLLQLQKLQRKFFNFIKQLLFISKSIGFLLVICRSYGLCCALSRCSCIGPRAMMFGWIIHFCQIHLALEDSVETPYKFHC